jgi:phage head maturation protease
METYTGDVYGQFHLAMPIQKTVLENENGENKMIIAGVASGVSTDLESDRMTDSAIHAFEKAISDGLTDSDGSRSFIPLMTGHRKEWSDRLGWITKATVDDEKNLWIEAELDETSSIARDLFHKLQVGSKPNKPLKLGFSVGGFITKARKEYDMLTKKAVRIIEDVLLDEISVVGSPAYAPSFLDVLNKSARWETVPTYYDDNQGDNSMDLLQAAQEAKDLVRAEELAKNEAVSPVTARVENTAPAVAADAVNTDDVINLEAAQVVTDNEAVVEAQNNAVVANADAAEAQVAADDAAQVNANPPVADPVVAEAANDGALKELQDQVRSLTDSVTALLAAQQNVNIERGVAEPVTKAAEEVKEVAPVTPVATPEVLTKSTQDFVAEAVTNALIAFKSEFLDPMVQEVVEVRKSVEDMSKQPMDKSIAVRETPNLAAIDEFRKRFADAQSQSNGKAVNPIRASLEASLKQNA